MGGRVGLKRVIGYYLTVGKDRCNAVGNKRATVHC